MCPPRARPPLSFLRSYSSPSSCPLPFFLSTRVLYTPGLQTSNLNTLCAIQLHLPATTSPLPLASSLSRRPPHGPPFRRSCYLAFFHPLLFPPPSSLATSVMSKWNLPECPAVTWLPPPLPAPLSPPSPGAFTSGQTNITRKLLYIAVDLVTIF